MGTSVLLVFAIPLMIVYFIASGVCSLFGVNLDALWDTLTGTETTDAVLSAIAGAYNILEPILKPILEMFSGII